MSVNNPVLQVLVTTENALAANNGIDDLTTGQIGVFNADTNVSVSATTATAGMDFYLAAKSKDGVTVHKSAGQYIQGANVKNYTYQAPVDGIDGVFDIDMTDCKVECEVDYTIKLQLENENFYRLNGYNQTVKTFTARAECCTTCPDDDDTTNAITLIKTLVGQINDNSEGLITATYVDRNVTNPVTISNIDTWAADVANAGLVPSIRISLSSPSLTDYCHVNPDYDSFRQFKATIALGGIEATNNGFGCCGSVVEITPLTYPEGLGYDLAELEYESGGFDGTPGVYRVSELTNLPIGSFKSEVDKATKYHVVSVQQLFDAPAGTSSRKHNIETVIAGDTCSEVETVTDILDKILGKTTAISC